jgi:hypothetical protein
MNSTRYTRTHVYHPWEPVNLAPDDHGLLANRCVLPHERCSSTGPNPQLDHDPCCMRCPHVFAAAHRRHGQSTGSQPTAAQNVATPTSSSDLYARYEHKHILVLRLTTRRTPWTPESTYDHKRTRDAPRAHTHATKLMSRLVLTTTRWTFAKIVLRFSLQHENKEHKSKMFLSVDILVLAQEQH